MGVSLKRHPLLIVLLLVLVGAGALLRWELRTSRLTAYVLTRYDRGIRFELGTGQSSAIRFPDPGPYDLRLGYARLPEFLSALSSSGFVIEKQACASTRLLQTMDRGLFPVYREKDRAGLSILDRRKEVVFAALYPGKVYPSFKAVPELIASIVLFIENRELLDPDTPHRNPAVEWDRLASALFQAFLRIFDRTREVPGGSTLAVQMEKYRHSPSGITFSAREKVRQMATASLRAYLDGEETIETRRRILCGYLNSLPLAAVSGHGEVIGLGDGLAAWYGADLDEATRLLSVRGDEIDPSERGNWGLALRQVVSLLLAQRKPSVYLRDKEALGRWVDAYLRILASGGVLTPVERDLALRARLSWRDMPLEPPAIPFVERKAANTVRTRLLSLLRLQSLYDLDRFDLTVESTLDARVQHGVTRLLRRLQDPDYVREAGLQAFRLLERGDPSRVIYSVTVYERGEGANLLRVQTDNFNQPLNINEGSRLELGSSAKLRTLVTYLEIIAELHARLAALPRDALRAEAPAKTDPLTAWAFHYLASSSDTSLAVMLEAAMERRYSASPADGFFTGGGLHRFSNFDSEDDTKVYSVRDGFRHSVNLVYIRLMRDVVEYFKFRGPGGDGGAGERAGSAAPGVSRALRRQGGSGLHPAVLR
ncbi:MAG: transglycosylase domain-containing protein [Candidatus Eisenbacteria bacterium]